MAREFENAKHPEHSEGYKGPRHLRDFVDEDDYKEEDFEDEDDNESQTVTKFHQHDKYHYNDNGDRS